MEDTTMMADRSYRMVRIVYSVSFLMVMCAIGCEPPAIPTSTNPYNPYSPMYRMNAPFIGTITVSPERVATIPTYYADAYASSILVERREGFDASFQYVGRMPVSQGIYSETIPPAQPQFFFYRIRCEAPGGALSPYSYPREVYVP